MKTNGLKVAGLVFGSLALGVLALAGKHIALDSLPDAVKAAIEKKAPGAVIKEVEMETRDGKSIYEVEVMKDGAEVEYVIGADGMVLGMETDEDDKGGKGGMEDDDDEGEEEGEDDDDEETTIAFEALPAGALAAAREIVGNNPVKKVESEKEHGTTLYEVEYTVEGVEYSVEMTANGDILELEHAIKGDELPAAAIAHLQKKYPGATIDEAEVVQKFYYEVEITNADGEKEIAILATGHEMYHD